MVKFKSMYYKTKNRVWILILSIISIFLSGCKTEEFMLHGEISGIVTDASTIKPVGAAYVKLSKSNDSTTTGNDGTYLLKSLTPGDYEIQASKSSFVTSNNKVTVVPAKTQVNDFSLNPVPKISVSVLDFSLESTSLSFTISYAGKTKLSYLFSTSQDWINVYPTSGDLLGETDTITVTINRTGLTENIYKETIKMRADVGQVSIPDIITGVYLNGARDQDGNYYKVVKIGTQTWMAENLNVGISISGETEQADNGIIEKYCNNCNIYGGLYQWNEMMGYNLPDSGIIGNTQGICPTGWHIPTNNEWTTLTDYLGGLHVAGGKLKETGTNHWFPSPDAGATNESGFTGLPAGLRLPLDAIAQDYKNFYKESAIWWSSTWSSTVNNFVYYKDFYVRYDDVQAFITESSPDFGMSVRCVKDE